VPFPESWRKHLSDGTQWWSALTDEERSRMEDLIRMFLADKSFEGTRGFVPTAEMRLMIAAQACLLILRLDYSFYDDVTSIVVSPTVIHHHGPRHLDGGIVSDASVTLSGQAMLHGPVLIVWDRLTDEARHPERGHNVVFHEFAHKLDMRDGAADGIPPLTAELAERWEPAIQSVLGRLRTVEARGLDSYGATNPAELLAVATEAFFDTPDQLRRAEGYLYTLLARFYQQDPAARSRGR
jgi:MtfA peptidase